MKKKELQTLQLFFLFFRRVSRLQYPRLQAPVKEEMAMWQHRELQPAVVEMEWLQVLCQLPDREGYSKRESR